MNSIVTTMAVAKLLSALAVANAAASTFDADAKNNVALYWGQNSAGSQERLSYYCESGEADIFLLSFLYEFPDPMSANFADACTSTYSDGMLDCPTIAEDIKTCQNLGKKVLLSLGGSSGAYGFTNDTVATEFASTLWNYFGEGSSDDRPFGDAVVDGFDFDIENNENTGYTSLVTELRSIFSSKGSKQYYISAAPQCVYPDAGVGEMLLQSDVDFAFVQFYNNYCNVDADFNWDTWVEFAEEKAYNSDIKLFLGLPGSATAAGSGYLSDLSVVESTVSEISSNSHFGGIMLWDASQGYANIVDGENYVVDMKNILNDYATSSPLISTSTSTSPLISISGASTTTSAYSSSSAKVSTKASSQSSTRVFSTTSTEVSTKTPVFTQVKVSSEVSAKKPVSTQAKVSTKASLTSATVTTSSIIPTVATHSNEEFSSSTTLTTSSHSEIFSISTISSRNWDEPLTTETVTLSNGQVTTSHIWWLPETTVTSTDNGSSRNWDEPLTTETVTLPDGQVTTSHIWWLPESSVISAVENNTLPTSASKLTTRRTTLLSPTPYFSNTTVSASSSASKTSSVVATATSSADASAIALNQQFAAGKLNGKDTCNTNDMACDAEGRFALCSNGAWSFFECSAGTTCYAYTAGDQVEVNCNYSYLKDQFM